MDQSRTVPAASATIEVLRGLPSHDRLLGLYEYALEGCAQRRGDQVSAALEELICMLDFQYGEVTEGFYRVYEYCLRKTREGQFTRVAWILGDLHQTLNEAGGRGASPGPPDGQPS